MAYPTAAELVAASTVAELTDLEPAQQEGLRDEAILAIEGVCRQSFEVEGTEEGPVARTVDGGGADTLYLPKRLVKLVELSVPGGALSATDVALHDDFDRLHLQTEPASGSTWATRAIADITGAAHRTFPRGPGTVTISGIWGWEEAPQAVVTALRYDMEDRALANAHALSESVRSARALGLEGINQGGLSVQLGRGEPSVSTRVERLLDPDCIWQSSAGGVV